MVAMFHGAKSFNQPIGKWDVRKLRHANNMFRNATSFKQSIVEWRLVGAATQVAQSLRPLQ